MTPVETFHWNPKQPRFKGRVGRRIPTRRRLNNFGDLLGPMIVNALIEKRGLSVAHTTSKTRLLTVGSILHFARDGDVVWGSGINGKFASQPLKAKKLDIRAVRGPLTRKSLLRQGISAPEIYGDPGLLASFLWPELQTSFGSSEITFVRNFNDTIQVPSSIHSLDPLSPVETCLRRLATSSLVVGSSLHAIIVAESFGVPARLIRSAHEPPFKYDDYYAGTGRNSYKVADSVEEAVRLGGETPPNWSPDQLLEAFPWDLWESKAVQ